MLTERKTTFDLLYEGFRLTGTATIEPYLPPDGVSPAEPENAEIVEIYIDGKPGADLLNPRVEQWAIERILKAHHVC